MDIEIHDNSEKYLYQSKGILPIIMMMTYTCEHNNPLDANELIQVIFRAMKNPARGEQHYASQAQRNFKSLHPQYFEPRRP